jgi:hypothetical protein
LIVFTEGRKTEPSYLNQLHRLHRERVVVTIDDFHGGPLELVERAAQRRKHDLRDEKKGKGAAYDEYWCIFDVDEHPHVAQALVMARDNNVQLAVSNPCIELWFVLHKEDRTGWVHRHDIQARCRDLLGFDKTLGDSDVLGLMGAFEAAKRRAEHLDAKHDQDQSPPGNNPSTSAHRLVSRITQ